MKRCGIILLGGDEEEAKFSDLGKIFILELV